MINKKIILGIVNKLNHSQAQWINDSEIDYLESLLGDEPMRDNKMIEEIIETIRLEKNRIEHIPLNDDGEELLKPKTDKLNMQIKELQSLLKQPLWLGLSTSEEMKSKANYYKEGFKKCKQRVIEMLKEKIIHVQNKISVLPAWYKEPKLVLMGKDKILKDLIKEIENMEEVC